MPNRGDINFRSAARPSANRLIVSGGSRSMKPRVAKQIRLAAKATRCDATIRERCASNHLRFPRGSIVQLSCVVSAGDAPSVIHGARLSYGAEFPAAAPRVNTSSDSSFERDTETKGPPRFSKSLPRPFYSNLPPVS